MKNTVAEPLGSPSGSVLNGVVITRDQLAEVLDRNLELAGVKITVRRYNTILTELGFTLDDEPPELCAEKIEQQHSGEYRDEEWDA